ncbi:hypothetical protein [Streptomyces sp. WAC01280]|uniref:hypothetical protein n=1 Tax=Streptomyces sp. WAC01280 TaxID=2487424 RepID=UPI000F7B7F25|nr:hypothetical protein [Streptomyces sp. WAC01280]RSS59782.1 hypothetical protein EF909_07940 [Streptomyces sp. WAC01280]
MLIVHSPADGEVERFDFRSVRTSEASIITGLVSADLNWQQVKQRLADEDPDVLRAVAFVIKKRSHPSLRIADFDPLVGELGVRLDRKEVEEWAEIAAERIAETELPAEVIEMSLSTILDEADDTDHARETIQRLLAGKSAAAPAAATPVSDPSTTEESTSSAASTSDSSPTSSTSTEAGSTT